MPTYLDAKAMARRLRARLAQQSIELSHAGCLELLAAQFGCADWNELAARIARDAHDAVAAIRFDATKPVLRIFDVGKALEFYRDFLGFAVDWEHRFEPGLPLYMQISRGALVLHLSEHHGDGSPGAVTWIDMRGLDAFKRELRAKSYRNLRPGIRAMSPQLRVMEVIDPFGNRLRFGEHGEVRTRGDANADD